MKGTKGFAYAFGWNSYYRKILGICSMDNEGPVARQRAWILTLLIFISIWLPGAATVAILRDDLNLCIHCLSNNMPIAVSMAKMIFLQCHRKVTGSILGEMAEDWARVETKQEYKTMLEIARLSRFISILSVLLSIVMFLAYVLSRVWMSVKNYHLTTDDRLSTDLLHDSYFPFDTKSLTIFVPLWISQFFGSFLGMISYAGPDSLVSMMVLHLCGQLRIIRDSIKCLVNDTTFRKPEKYWKKIGDIVKRHEELNQLSVKLRDTFSSVLLVQMVACSITFCFQCYTMFTTLTERNGAPFPILELTFSVVHAVYTLIHLFLYCYVGEQLCVESASLADDFYDTTWYDLEPKEVKAFLFIWHRSDIPLEIKAGKFCTFNLQLFSSIMKSSMGYLSMLMAMKERMTE